MFNAPSFYIPFIRKIYKYLLEDHNLQYGKKTKSYTEQRKLMVDIDTLS